jgi:hypothetical protein
MRINKSLITYIPSSGAGSGTVTSVALTAPTGFSVSGSPITSSGTLALSFASGYSLPTNTKQGQWDSAYAFTSGFPTGTAQQLLRVNTLGTALEFFTPSYIVSTDIIATSPLVWNSGTKTMSIPVATNSANGYLSSADWLTFSSKQNAITLTTTGNNGSATLVGATLNIPTYTLVGLGGMSNPFSTGIGQMIYSNGAGAPLSLAPNTTTTKKFLAMTGDGTNGDAPFWDTISGITGSGTTNYVPKFTSSSALGNSLIYDDGTNVGISNLLPAAKLHVSGTFISTAFWNDSGGVSYWGSYNTAYGALTWSSGYALVHATSGNSLYLGANGNNTHASINSSGNFGIGVASANAKLQISGGSLATGGSGTLISSGLTNGRLETYQSGTANCIHTWLDNNTYEISAGSTAGYVSGLVITGRDASLLPDRVAIYTRSLQRFQIGSLGQLQLNSYTSATSFTGTPVAYLACDSVGNIITSNPAAGRSIRIAFSAEVPNTWANMPNTLQFFDSSSAYVTQIDLTDYNQVRLIVNKQGTAGATGSKLLVRYQATTGTPFDETLYSAIGSSEVSVAVDTTNTIITSSWINLVSGAKADVWVALMGIDGDTTADPVFGNIYAEFRYNP